MVFTNHHHHRDGRVEKENTPNERQQDLLSDDRANTSPGRSRWSGRSNHSGVRRKSGPTLSGGAAAADPLFLVNARAFGTLASGYKRFFLVFCPTALRRVHWRGVRKPRPTPRCCANSAAGRRPVQVGAV